MLGVASVNATSLLSPFAGKPVGLTRIRACVVRVAGMVPVYEPVVAVAVRPEAIGLQVVPLSELKSTSNNWELPRLWVHVIVRTVPAAQVTAVFGAVTATAEPILKFTSLMSFSDSVVELTRI